MDDEIAALTAERDENTCREDFTTAEVHDIAKRLLAQEKEAAKARAIEGNRKGGKAPTRQVSHQTRETSPEPEPAKPKPRAEREPEAVEKVAKAVGVGASTLRRIEAVYEAAEENPKLAPVRESLEREERAAPAYCGSGGGSNCVTLVAPTSQLL